MRSVHVGRRGRHHGPDCLTLNSSLPLNVSELYVGRQITMPSPDDIARNVQVIDASVARLFYEAKDYYRAFEREFNAQLREQANTTRE